MGSLEVPLLLGLRVCWGAGLGVPLGAGWGGMFPSPQVVQLGLGVPAGAGWVLVCGFHCVPGLGVPVGAG